MLSILSFCFYFNTFWLVSTEEVVSPTDLQFYEISDKKIVLTWSGPPGDVSGYRVTVMPLDEAGSPQREMTLPVSQNSYIEVPHLEPGTLYRFNIYTTHNGEESLPLIGEQTTSECMIRSRGNLLVWQTWQYRTVFVQHRSLSDFNLVFLHLFLLRAWRSHRYPLCQHHRGQSCDDLVCPTCEN